MEKRNSKLITFLPLSADNKPAVLEWFESPHVREFYHGEGLQNTLKNIDLFCQGINTDGRYYFDHWVGFYNDEPFAFLMTSPIAGPFDPESDYDKYFVESKKTFTLDLLIGPIEFLGKGLAAEMIVSFILDKFSDADYFLIDPSQSNPKAVHVYEKVGFKKIAEFVPEYDPVPHWMMRLDVSELKKGG